MSEADSPEGSGVAVTGTPGQGPTPRPGPSSDGRAPLPGAAVVVDLFDPRRTGDRAAINEALLWHDSPDPTVARPARSLRGRDHTPLHEVGRPAPAGAQRRPGYLPALDGLRAVSVAAVLAYHLGRLGGGFLGVDVFFVVSGFLITRLLLLEREDTGGTDLIAFWQRRFRRLLPATGTLVEHHFRRVLLRVAQDHLESVGDEMERAAAEQASARRIETGAPE